MTLVTETRPPPPPPPAPSPWAAPGSLGRRLLFSEYLVLYLCVAYFVAVAPFVPGFATAQNVGNIVSNLLPLLIVATGQTLVLISGGIDLSVASIIALSSVAGATLVTGDGGWLHASPAAVPAGIAAMLLVGAAAGALNGFAVARLGMPAFIVTLTTMMFFSGSAIWYTQSQNIFNLPAGFTAFGRHTSLSLLAAGAVVLAVHLLLSRSLLGGWLYAVGHNARAARVSGVAVRRVLLLVYVASGLCAAAAALLYTGRLETGSPVLAQGLLLDIIGATVIGGTSLYGGRGKVIWTLFGVLFLTLIDNSLNLMGLSHFTIMMVKGAVILFAALIDATRQRVLALGR